MYIKYAATQLNNCLEVGYFGKAKNLQIKDKQNIS